MSDRPLITFIVCAYKQEQYVREAVAGALAQTYSPLEVILSDDCSPDRTFAIMEEMAAAYQGPHRIILNRNPTNQRTAAHVNRIVELSTGELIIGNAGDDASLPHRTDIVAKHWLETGKRAYSIYSGLQVMDAGGRNVGAPDIRTAPGHSRSIPESVRNIRVGVPGCTHGFRREIFEIFGPMPLDVVNEDEALAFRSLMLGEIAYVPEALVLYRRHDENVSGRNITSWDLAQNRADYRRRSTRDKAVFDSWLRDVRTAREQRLRPVEELDAAERGIEAHLRYLGLELQLVEMSTPRAVLATLAAALGPATPRKAIRAFTRTQIPMPLRTLRTRLFGTPHHAA